MKLDKYNKKMDEYKNKSSMSRGKEWDKLYEEISTFQQHYMNDVLKKYEKEIDCQAKERIYDILFHAVEMSQTGNSIIYVDTEEEADEIDNILWEEIGCYLLDCQIYKENDRWAIDCMFGGYYVPYWDGWSNN